MISYPYVHPGMLVPAPTPRKPTYKKSMWTEGEDEQLRRAIKEVGFNNWSVVAAMVPGRTGKQCRERWFGMLSPDLAKEDWTPEEDQLLLRLHSEYGAGTFVVNSKAHQNGHEIQNRPLPQNPL